MQVSKARRKLLCSLCRQPHGACIQCAGSAACFTAFHPLCARAAGCACKAFKSKTLPSKF